MAWAMGDSRSWRRNGDATVIVLADAGHGFMSTSSGNNQEFAKQSHFAPGYWDTMAQRLDARGFARQPARPAMLERNVSTN